MTPRTGLAAAAMAALTILVGPGGLSGAAPAAAQEMVEPVATETDWGYFESREGGLECWIASAPKEQSNTRDGAPVTVQRGETRLFVNFRPGSGVAGEVSYTGGYPFAPGSPVTVAIAGREFELFTDGEWAWPASADGDAELVAAMRGGSEATVVARSARGTRTEDTFSLLGFSSMLERAETTCAAS